MKNQQRLPVNRWSDFPTRRLTQEELTRFIQSCKVYKDKKAISLFWREQMQSLLTNNQSNTREWEELIRKYKLRRLQMNKQQGLTIREEKALDFAYKVHVKNEHMLKSSIIKLSEPLYQQGWLPLSKWSEFAKDRLTKGELREVILDLYGKGLVDISIKHKTFKITSRGKYEAILAEVSRGMERGIK